MRLQKNRLTSKQEISIKGKYSSLLLTLLGFVVYLWQAFHFAFTQRSILDEGLYLYKGLLFARGTYSPFQDYGFWTQKSPLSYLIYGWVQQLFGPGLRTGRIFAIFIGAIAILGMVLVASRMGGRWWGTASVWVVALNPVSIRYFSVAMSQCLVACLLMWMLFFTLGETRTRWQIVVGSLLAGIMVMARQNMAPALIILVLYLFWQRGWKTGLLAALACMIPLLVVHAAYWPEILKMWTPWLPERWTPFLDAWRLSLPSSPQVNGPDLSGEIQSLLEGFRFHFTALTGGLVALLLWPASRYWKDRNQYRSSVFLMVLFLALLGLHLWAGLGNTAANNNNAFTFSPYLAFFDLLGILILASLSPSLKRPIPVIQQTLASVFLFAVSVGIGYGGFEVMGDGLATIHLPRVRDFFTTWKFLPGNVMLWQIVANKFGIEYDTSRLLFPTIALALAGLLLILLGFIVWFILRRRSSTSLSFATIVVTVFLVLGTLLASTPVLGGGFREWVCTGNVIEEFEKSGQYLAKVIPSQSQVYWDGGNAVAVLLYVPDIRIFPQQFDADWNYLASGDSDRLARFGFWDKELASRWRESADVFIFQEKNYSGWKAYVNTEAFNEPSPTSCPLNCVADTYLRIFIRER
jgi:hypothetical protein